VPEINCYVPIKLRISGRVDDELLDGLERQLVPLIGARLALAERTIAGRGIGPGAAGGAEVVREDFQAAGYDPTTSRYGVPSYQGQGRPTALPVRRAPGRGGLTDEQRRRIRTTVAQLEHDDGSLFLRLLAQSRARGALGPPDPLNLAILRAFARRNPTTFRKLLLAALTQGDEVIARALPFKRSEDNIVDIGKGNLAHDPAARDAVRLLDIGADALHLAREMPEAAAVVQEWERRHPGIQRLLALVDQVIRVRRQFLEYLRGADEPSEAAVIEVLESRHLERLPVLVAAWARGKQGATIIAGLDADLMAHIRWIAVTWENVKEIDSLLGLYRFAAGQAADQLEEVAVLREARSRYLDALAMSPFPTAARIVALLGSAGKFYGDWQGQAADKKLEDVKAGLKEVKEVADRMPIFGTGAKHSDIYDEFNRKHNELWANVAAFRRSLESAGKQKRGMPQLAFANQLQQKLGELNVNAMLLQIWVATLLVPAHAESQDLGDDDDRAGWERRAGAIRAEIKQEYDHPDLSSLSSKVRRWQDQLQALVDAINKEAEEKARRERRKVWYRLGITLVAIVVTEGAYSLAGGLELSVTETTLLGAGTFTAVQTLGRAVILGERVNPTDVLVEFGENAAAFGLLHWLNLRFVAGARSLAPGRDLMQFAIVFGANTVAGTGINAALSRINTGRWPADWREFFLSGLVVAAAGAMLGGLRARIGALKGQLDLLTRLDGLIRDGNGIINELQTIGRPTGPQQFEAMRQRILPVAEGVADVFGRLSGPALSDADLAELGLSRARVREVAGNFAQYADICRGAKWSPPPAGTGGARALPAPDTVVLDLVELEPGTFAYDPDASHQQPEQVARALRHAGYQVTDNGGVLELTGPGGVGRPQLLLPAAPPAEGAGAGRGGGAPTGGGSAQAGGLPGATGWRHLPRGVKKPALNRTSFASTSEQIGTAEQREAGDVRVRGQRVGPGQVGTKAMNVPGGRTGLRDHWLEHGGEFPEYRNARQYEQGAITFCLDSTTKRFYYRYQGRPTIGYYNEATGTFAATSLDGETIYTYFRPEEGIPAFLRKLRLRGVPPGVTPRHAVPLRQGE
jgi:hypothetical protein